jgi:nucleoside-diphosphate-sugar epimerase
MYKTNVDGSVAVVEAAARAGVERLVYTSSVAVLGIRRDRRPADEETPVGIDDMIGPYKRSKFLAEDAVRRRAAELDVPLVIVNLRRRSVPAISSRRRRAASSSTARRAAFRLLWTRGSTSCTSTTLRAVTSSRSPRVGSGNATFSAVPI